jgi:hypothetical protein
MKGSRWFVVAAALAVVVLVAPASGAGRDASGWLAWSQGGVTMTSYAFSTVSSGSRASTSFWLKNWGGRAVSGKLAIRLTGSPAFSIGFTGCTGKKSLGVRKSCRVNVVYAPTAAGARDRAVLTATRKHRVAARLEVAGCTADGAGHVYWASEDAGSVNKGLFAGGCPTAITTLASGQDAPYSLAADGTYVYWANSGGTVNEVPLGGGTVTTLARGQGYIPSLAADGTYVYWTDCESYCDAASGTVKEVPVGGGTVTTLASGQDYPSSVAVDGTNVYWTDIGTYPDFNGTVNEVPLGGGSVTTLASGQDYPSSVAVDGTHVYWGCSSGTVNEVPVGGGTVTTLASGQGYPTWVAVDGTHVYWVNYYEGTVNEVPLGGGTVTAVAAGVNDPYSVAMDGVHVYWGSLDDGLVREVPRGGGRVNVVARDQGQAPAVVVGP